MILKNKLLIYMLMLMLIVVAAKADWVLDSTNQFGSCTFVNTTYDTTNSYVYIPDTRAEYIVTDNIVASWWLDDGDTCSGCTVDNYRGIYNATKSTLGASTDAIINNSVDFEASTGGLGHYINISDNDVFSFGDGVTDKPFSVSLWAKPESFDPTGNFLITKDDLGSNREYVLNFESSGSGVNFVLRDSITPGDRIGRKDTAGFSTGRWYHIVATYNGNQSSSGMKIYINGTQGDDTNNNVGSYVAMNNTVSEFRIGAVDTGSGTLEFDGLLDEVILFNKTLTDTEVLNIYNSQLSGFTQGTLTCSNTTTQTYNNWQIRPYLGWELHSELRGENLEEPLNTTGLVGYWDMNDDGNTIVDYSGNNNNGTNTGASSNATGKFNTAYDFEDTEDDYITISDSPELDGMNAITISMWVKRESTGAVHYLLGKNTNLRVDDSYRFYLDSTNKVFLAPRDSCTVNMNGWETSGTIGAGSWNHIVVNYDLGNAYAYINGVNQTLTEVGTQSLPTGAIATCNSDLYLGRRGGSTAMMDGLMDEVIIYNRTLSTSEIQNLYNRGLSKLNATSTLGYNIGTGETNVSLADTLSSSVNITFNFFRDNANITYPRLVWSNITTTVAGPTTVDTSLYGIHDEIADFSFSSTEYTQGFATVFNTSINTSLIAMGSFNVQKTSGTPNADIDLLVQVDGINISETTVRNTGTLNSQGSTGVIANFSVGVGQHNITTYWRSSSVGTVNIDDIDWSLGQLESDEMNDVDGNTYDINVTFSSTSFQPVYNFTVTKSGANLSTYYNLNAYLVSGDAPSVYCRISDGDYFVRDLSGGSVGSASISYIEQPTATKTESLYCRTHNGASVNLYGKLVEFSLGDQLNNTVQGINYGNSTSNSTSGYTLTSGTYELIKGNMTNLDGTQTFMTSSVSFESDSGANTPTVFMNVSNVGTNNCYTKKERTFTSTNSVGNAYMYHMCYGLSVGQEYNYSLYITVPAGETVTVYDEALNIFESNPFNITAIEPPSGLVTNVALSLPSTGTVATAFDLGINTTCTGLTCINVYRNITSTPAGCTIAVGDENAYLGNFSGQYNETVQYSCLSANTYTFNVTSYNLVSSFTASANITIGGAGGLSLEQESCLLTGKYLNNTPCGAAFGGSPLETNVCPDEPGTMLVLFLLLFISLFFIVIGWLFKLSFSGFLGSLMLLIGSWTIYGCSGFIAAIIALFSLMCLLWFSLNFKGGGTLR